MGEDIKPEVIKKTQDALGQFIKKPVLTEKLLRKPPFRFLHDIVSSVVRETGFLKGLYSDTEMLSENIKEKDAKIVFLQKLVDCLKIVTGKNVSARPSKIVAGLEPTKTNELLQIMGYALHKKLDSTSAIQQLQQATVKPKAKSKDDKRVEPKTRDRSDKIKSTPRSTKPTELKVSSRKPDDRPENKVSPRSKTDKLKATKSKDEVKKSKSSSHADKKDSKTKDVPKTPDSSKEKRIVVSEPSLEKTQEVGEKTKTEEAATEVVLKQLPDSNVAVAVASEEAPGPTPTPKVDQESVQRETIAKKKDFSEEKRLAAEPEVLKSKESSKIDVAARPKTSLRPPSVRPSSARPGAPRLKDRNEVILPPDELVPMGKVNVIVEHFSVAEDDNEETVVMESSVEPAVEEPRQPAADLPAEKGHLVEQILEQLGDGATENSQHKSKVEVDWNAGNERNRAAADKEMGKLRDSIQALTRAANPLGKLMNFLQEDVESMRSELQHWTTIHESVLADINIMLKKNEESIQPLRQQLAQIEEDIAQQRQEILNTRANILRNEQKIKLLLKRES